MLASAFFPDPGRHKLTLYPTLVQDTRSEQIETLVHEIAHIFGLRHFFATVSETQWPAEICGTHSKFSIMNRGGNSKLTGDTCDRDAHTVRYQISGRRTNGWRCRSCIPVSSHMPDTSRPRPRWLLPVFGIAMVVAAACGGDDSGSPTVPPGTDTTLTASLSDGAPFTAIAANINVIQGRVFIVATNGANEQLGLGFELQNGVQYSGTAGNATASYARSGQGGGSWAAGSNLATSSGTVTLTTATANRIVGSFDFTLVGSGNTTPATLRFINGRLDIRY